MFPRGLYTPAEPSFNALFRLLDDFESYNQGNANGHTHGHKRPRQVQTFNPRFDVFETENAYELHGDLAGLEKDNVQLEFTDPQTLVIRGRVERKYEAGTPPTANTPAAVEDSNNKAALPEKEGEWQDVSHHKEHQATVSDEKDENETTTTEAAPVATPATTNTEVAKSTSAGAPAQKPKHNFKYWVSERSVGEFSRTFSFPTRIEQDAVKANLNNGVLTVTVPKAKKYETRRITVN